MLFSSIPFLYYYLPATVLIYYIVPQKFKNSILLFASLLFYAWGEKTLVLLFAATIFAGWVLGILIEKTRGSIWSKICVVISVITDLGLLCYFKYADFFIDSFNKITGLSLPLLRVALPIGISFYTFQIMSYTIDVYRNDVKAQKNLIDLGTYVALFPQLIAGPIVRYSDIEGQLKVRTHTISKAAAGTRRFITGLAKKVLIANALGEVCEVFRQTDEPSVLYFWLYAICFMLQIYFDFSGYSDMAIGLGRIFGFEFAENFNYPYCSTSITEFWRRWHISLGTWFRDYVYIPLGGNRKGLSRQLFNIFVVWMLTGLWHGAAWNFVLWGLLYAILLTIEKSGLKKYLDLHHSVGHIYVLFTVLIGFVLFNAPSLRETVSDISGMFGLGGIPFCSAEAIYYLMSYLIIIVFAVIGATPLPKKLFCYLSVREPLKKASVIAEPIIMIIALVLVTAYLVDGSFNPFLYFRF